MIRKRKNSKNQISYQVIIRYNDGHPSRYETFPTMQEAKDWEIKEPARRRIQTCFPEKVEKKHTVADLIKSYTNLLQHLGKKIECDILLHLKWWNNEIGNVQLSQIRGEKLAECRTELLEEGNRVSRNYLYKKFEFLK